MTELRRADGAFVCELERGDSSTLLDAGWQPPERFVAKGRDGVTDIYGVIYRPTTLDPAKEYAVIEKIYALLEKVERAESVDEMRCLTKNTRELTSVFFNWKSNAPKNWYSKLTRLPK